MSWISILKAKGHKRKKMNMDNIRKLLNHFLEMYSPPTHKQFALSTINNLVSSTYRHFNPKHKGGGSGNMKHIISQLLVKKGYIKLGDARPDMKPQYDDILRKEIRGTFFIWGGDEE